MDGDILVEDESDDLGIMEMMEEKKHMLEDYISENPISSVLIAAGAGMMCCALLSEISRKRKR